MSSRLDAFRSLRYHAFYGRDFLRLKPVEIAACEAFIAAKQDLDHLTFERTVLCWNVDSPEARGPRFSTMTDLLLAANNVAEQARR